MRISVFGMGYVGCVSAGCLTDMGHLVVGVDPNPLKLEMINQGRSPIIEPGLDELIARAVKAGRFRATADWHAAIRDTDLAIICVGTPSRGNGSADLSWVVRVCEQIGEALALKTDYFTVVVRSTVTPGTLEETIIPVLEACSRKKAGPDFGVCMNPEFLREGTSIADFYNPPKVVIGELDSHSGDALAEICRTLPCSLVRTQLRVAEMVKYTDNAFHALKICFANEIGNLCQAMGIDSHKVMELFCMDTKLNLSPAYLKPGFAFGGSCLPKDLRSISFQANRHEVPIPLLDSILESNQCQVQKVVDRLLTYKGRSLGFLGLSFKEGTDDLRESPVVEVIEKMIGKGFKVLIHDRNVLTARLMGANKEFIEKEIPHVSDLLCSSAGELIAASDVLVVANKDPEYVEHLKTIAPNRVIIDLVRMFGPRDHPKAEYYGICW